MKHIHSPLSYNPRGISFTIEIVAILLSPLTPQADMQSLDLFRDELIVFYVKSPPFVFSFVSYGSCGYSNSGSRNNFCWFITTSLNRTVQATVFNVDSIRTDICSIQSSINSQCLAQLCRTIGQAF